MNRITTRFGSATTATEAVDGVNLKGKTIIVTGGAGGIGIETVRALARAGAAVTIAARRPAAAEIEANRLRVSTGNCAIDVQELDLSDLESVRRFASAWDRPLHVLINNAGIMALPHLERNANGHEMQFATNFLGHFALALNLHNWLKAAKGARVVSVSSAGSLWSPILWDDIDFRFLPYDPIIAYGQSKTACILMSVAISRKWQRDGIASNALNPGAIATNLQRYTGGLKTPERYRKTPQQGAATSVLLAASPDLVDVSGRYFDDCNEAKVVDQRTDSPSGEVARYALAPENAERLWQVASAMIGKV